MKCVFAGGLVLGALMLAAGCGGGGSTGTEGIDVEGSHDSSRDHDHRDDRRTEPWASVHSS